MAIEEVLRTTLNPNSARSGALLEVMSSSQLSQGSEAEASRSASVRKCSGREADSFKWLVAQGGIFCIKPLCILYSRYAQPSAEYLGWQLQCQMEIVNRSCIHTTQHFGSILIICHPYRCFSPASNQSAVYH